MQRRWKLLLVFAGLTFVAALVWWIVGTRPAWPPLPEPNGYALLVLAGTGLTNIPTDYPLL